MLQKKDVFQYLEQNKMEIAEFLGKLVRLETVNEGLPDTADESSGQRFISAYMREMGLEVHEMAFDKDGKRPNVAGIYKGAGEGEGILINAHMDVVPIDDPDRWKYPHFGGVIEDGRVYGRGANDCKQGIAAMVYAVKALQHAGIRPKGDVILLSSVGEESCEGGSLGAGPSTEKLIEMGYRPTCGIVGELSDLEIQIESASLFFFEVVVKGKTCHCGSRNQAMFPQPYGIAAGNQIGVDALEHLLPIIEMFYRKERDWNLNIMRSDVLGAGGNSGGVGAFTINPCSFSGGGYIGSVPAEARITYGMWFANTIQKEEMMKEIRDSIAAVCENDSWLKANPPEIHMPVIQDWPGFKTDKHSSVVEAAQRAYRDALGREPVISGFKAACDATWIASNGVPCLVVGPGTMENRIHTIDEFCDIDDLLKTAKIYASMMIDWCNQ